MDKIQNIIFDLGGVIFSFDFESANRSFARLGLPMMGDSPQKVEVLKLLNKYIDGFLTDEEFATSLLPYCGEGVMLQDVAEVLQSFSGEMPASRLIAIKQLKTRYRVFLLSNINDRMWQWSVDLFKEQGYEVNDLFDDVFLSYKMQLAKPNPEIYKQMIATTGIKPAETIYFDDLPQNIDAGNAIGFDSHLVKVNHLEDCLAYQQLTQTV